MTECWRCEGNGTIRRPVVTGPFGEREMREVACPACTDGDD